MMPRVPLHSASTIQPRAPFASTEVPADRGSDFVNVSIKVRAQNLFVVTHGRGVEGLRTDRVEAQCAPAAGCTQQGGTSLLAA
jgi:hypothetical protein